MGNIFWIYVGSIACEKANAIAGGIFWGGLLVLSLFTLKLIDKIGSSNLFFTFGGLCIIGFIVFLIFVKETEGLRKEEI